ncbi:hypothetical protein D1AOALGA4SA_7289 [Olavius algarvensis Delta 1 endosymbiont]|nr:hypothetical protein D1AOALGA4SA_7289 [Olavius algarvensis Delta 1 endosymbiont]
MLAWLSTGCCQKRPQGPVGIAWIPLSIEPAHKLKIDQNKLQNCRSNILNLVNVL